MTSSLSAKEGGEESFWQSAHIEREMGKEKGQKGSRLMEWKKSSAV